MNKFFTLALASLALVACSHSNTQNEESACAEMGMEAQEATEVRLNTMEHDGDIHSSVADHYLVQRTANDSLPKVTDTDGTVIVDNSVRLTLTKQGVTVFDRVFTKRDFPEAGSHTLYSISVLEDITWQESNTSAAHFMAYLRNPWEEESLTYAVTVSPNGQVEIMHVVVDEMTDAPAEEVQ